MKRFYSIFNLIITWTRPIFNVTVHRSHTELTKLPNTLVSSVTAIGTPHCSPYFNPSRANLRDHMPALRILRARPRDKRHLYALVATRDFVPQWEALVLIQSRRFLICSLERAIFGCSLEHGIQEATAGLRYLLRLPSCVCTSAAGSTRPREH